MDNILRCVELNKSIGNKKILNNINLELKSGKIIGLLGQNGDGKTTLIKLIAGLLVKSSGEIFVKNIPVGIKTKKIISYLPDKTYLNNWMKVSDTFKLFKDFYSDFNIDKAYDMLEKLEIKNNDFLRSMSKGTKEKIQLILVMSREASLYLLDEPIGGVDPISREYILKTIVSKYSENSSIIISTHLIQDIEKILDEFIFLSKGSIKLHENMDYLKKQNLNSLNDLFKEVLKCY